MSVTFALMAASAAYSAYNQYEASEAAQGEMAKQSVFNAQYIAEQERRQEVNETLAMEEIRKGISQTSVTAAALGRSTSDASVLTNMETIAGLGMEQILRDREEFQWELKSAKFKGETMEQQLESEKRAQTLNAFSGVLGTGIQASKYYDSGLPKKGAK